MRSGYRSITVEYNYGYDIYLIVWLASFFGISLKNRQNAKNECLPYTKNYSSHLNIFLMKVVTLEKKL